MAFHSKREVSRTNVIVHTLGMAIKYQIHAIHTTSKGTATLHYKEIQTNLRSLRTIVKEGIAFTNLTKRNPTHLLHLRGWVG
jgi:hypothetical protein